MDQPIRLVHIINSFEHGGAETMLRNMLLRRARDRFDVRVITLIDVMTLAGPIRQEGIPIDTLGMRPGVPDPRAVARLAWLLRRLRPNVIQTWMDHSNLIGALGARMAGGIPVVWGVHHSDHVAGVAKRTTLWTVDTGASLSRWLARRIVFCSEHAQRLYRKRGFDTERSLVIPNGFDMSAFRPDPEARAGVRRELGVNDSTPLIGLVARYDPLKDHATFLRAAAILATQVPEARFVMCGTGVDEHNAELSRRIDSSGLGGRVYRLGPRRDIARIQAALDVASSSSISEAFPLVLGEAMACGVPCVATDVGDSRLILGDIGRIVPVRGQTQMARAWREILDMTPDRRRDVGTAARARMERLFDLKVVMERYESLWSDVAEARGIEPAEASPCWRGEEAVHRPPGGHGHHNGHGHAIRIGRVENRKRRVLLVVESSSGGTGRHVLDLADGLMRRGCEVHLAYSTRRLDEIFVRRLEGLGGLRSLALLMRTAPHPSDVAALWRLRRYARRFGPFDIVHGHSSKGGAMARLAALGTPAASLYTIHGLVMMDPLLARWKRLMYLTIERVLSAATSRIIAVAPEELREAVRLGLGKDRLVLIPNGVGPSDLTPRESARRELGLADDQIAIGFVGRLVSAKAPEVLVEAMAEARKSLPKLRLVMVGSGPTQQALHDISRKLGVFESIKWLGHRDAREVMAAFDLLAMPSRKEGLPYVILEAMAAGLPIVATSTAGVEILVEPGVNGLVVPPDRPGEFAQALISLAGNADRLARFGQASRRMVRRFTIDQMVDATMDQYEWAVGHGLATGREWIPS